MPMSTHTYEYIYNILYMYVYLSTAICISMYVTCGPLYDNPFGSVYLCTKNRKELTYYISSTLKLAAKCPPSLYTICMFYKDAKHQSVL